MMLQIQETLFRRFSEEMNEDSDHSHEEHLKNLKNTHDIMINEVHPFFVSIWGDVWVNRIESSGGMKSEMIKSWIVALSGLTIDDICTGIVNLKKMNDGYRYPPNQLEFRELCLKSNNSAISNNPNEPVFLNIIKEDNHE